jgi:hypothetical protein
VAVADGQARQIRYFRSDGRFQRVVGGNGQGPGEFESLSALWLCGAERIYAMDRRSARVTVWTESGELRNTFNVTDPDPSGSFTGPTSPYRATCSANGELLVVGWGNPPYPSPRKAQFFSQTAAVSVLDTAGKSVAGLGDHFVVERVDLFDAAQNRGSVGPHPFGRELAIALVDDVAYLGFGEALGVSVFDRAGHLVRVLRGPDEDLSFSPELFERFKSSEAVASVFTRIESLGIASPTKLPAFVDLRVSPDGHVWLKRFQLPWEEFERWAIFAPDGGFLGELDMPSNFTTTEVGDD